MTSIATQTIISPSTSRESPPPSVNIWKIPPTGNSELVPLSLTYDASNPGPRIEAPYNHNGVVVFSGLFRIAETLPMYHEPYTIDPETPPRSMPGYWEDYRDSFDTETNEYDDAWVLEYSLMCDENGRLRNLPRNQNAEGLVGTAYVVKKLYNTMTCSEVPMSIESSDMSVIHASFEMLMKTRFCPTINTAEKEFFRLWNEYGLENLEANYVRNLPVTLTYARFQQLYRDALSSCQFVRTDANSQRIYFVGKTLGERIYSLNRFMLQFGVSLQRELPNRNVRVGSWNTGFDFLNASSNSQN